MVPSLSSQQRVPLQSLEICVAAKGKAVKPQTTVHEASDSEEEDRAGAGPSLKGVLQHMIQQGVSTQDGDRSVVLSNVWTMAAVRGIVDTK